MLLSCNCVCGTHPCINLRLVCQLQGGRGRMLRRRCIFCKSAMHDIVGFSNPLSGHFFAKVHSKVISFSNQPSSQKPGHSVLISQLADLSSSI